MQICIPEPTVCNQQQRQSIIEAKNKIKLNHDPCCNCCCCTSARVCYRYVQPEVEKSYAPIRYYWKSAAPMDDNTTYKLSYWECPNAAAVDPVRPQNWLVVGDGEMSSDTIYRSSYFNYLCAKPESPITPCEKQWLGRGPMQDVTTQKHDFTWKIVPQIQPYKAQNNLYCLPAPLLDCTTYRLSYFENDLSTLTPAPSYAPIRTACLPDIPMESETVMQLSYQCVEPADQVEKPWSEKPCYQLPLTPMDDNTTYTTSYMLPGTLLPYCGPPPTCECACPCQKC